MHASSKMLSLQSLSSDDEAKVAGKKYSVAGGGPLRRRPEEYPDDDLFLQEQRQERQEEEEEKERQQHDGDVIVADDAKDMEDAQDAENVQEATERAQRMSLEGDGDEGDDDDDDQSDTEGKSDRKSDRQRSVAAKGAFAMVEKAPDVMLDELSREMDGLDLKQNGDRLIGKLSRKVNKADLLTMFEELYNRWKGPDTLDRTANEQAHIMYDLGDKPTVDEIDARYRKLLRQVGYLQYFFKLEDMMTSDTNQGEDYTPKFNQLYDLVYSSRQYLFFEAYLENLRDPMRAPSCHVECEMFRFRPINYANLNPTQNLILYMLRLCELERLRKKGNILYCEIKTKEGYPTRAYREYKPIEEYVRDKTNKNVRFDHWTNATDKGDKTLRDTITYLEKTTADAELPELNTDRTITAWRNGIFFAKGPSFVRYDAGEAFPDEVMACKYFDQEFPEDFLRRYDGNYMKIDTPVKDILRYQGYSDEDMSFIFAMFGRLIFEPGTMDEWEVVLMLWGQAGTGKSSCTQACEQFFDKSDIAAMGNRLEKTFGLQPIIGKKLAVGNDIKDDFPLDAGDLQTMTSLETMPVNIKYGAAMTLKWNVPVVFAGNVLPRAWRDRLGSIERRLMLVPFKRAVYRRNNSFKKRIRDTYGSFYLLCVQAYHDWVRRFGKDDIWEHVPERIKRGQKVVRENGNTLESFLNDKEVHKASGKWVLEKDLLDRYRDYCARYNFKAQAFSDSDRKSLYRKHGIKRQYIERDTVKGAKAWYLQGVELAPKLDADEKWN